jgi:hypothetical protein
VNTPQETQLADDLHQLAADQHFPPDLDAIERRGQRRRRRGYAVRGLAGLTGVGVAVAAGLAVTSHDARPSRPAALAPTESPTRAPTAAGRTTPAETAAYVTQRIAAALSPGTFLIESRENTSSVGSPTQMITIWEDPQTGNTMLLQGSGAARLTYWEHDYFDSHKVLHWDQTQVNYGPRTWWTYNEHAAGPIQGAVPSGPANSSVDTPQQIAQMLKHGATIVGHPYVDGHRTVELSVGSAAAVQWKVWADAATYQVLRMAKSFPPGLNAPPIVANYTWTGRSAALVKLINQPQIPAGYRQVPVGS